MFAAAADMRGCGTLTPATRIPPRKSSWPAKQAGLARSRSPERAEIDRRVSRLPAAEEALDRRMQDDLVQLVGREEPVAAHGRILRGDRSRATGRSRSPAKMMWTTCFAAKLRAGAIESTIATGPSTGISSSIPTSSAQLAVQRVDEALAGVDAAARQEPVLAPCFSWRQRSRRPSSAGSPRHGCAARRAITARARGAEAADAALGLGKLVDLDEIELRHREHHELRDPHPRLDHERLARVGVQQDDAQLAPVAGVDQARRVHDREPVPRSEPGARLDEARVALRDRDREPGARPSPAPPGRARRARRRRGRAPRLPRRRARAGPRRPAGGERGARSRARAGLGLAARRSGTARTAAPRASAGARG